MRTRWMWCAVAVAVIGTLGAIGAPAGAPEAGAADEAVLALLQEDLDAQARFEPVAASMRGDRRHDHLLPDASAAGTAARRADAQARLARALAIDRAACSAEARLNAELLEYELKDRIEALRWFPERTPITQQNGPHIDLPTLPGNLTFTRPEHVEAWVARLEAMPAYLAQVEESMREGLRTGWTPAREVLTSVPEQIFAQAGAEFEARPESHPLYAPLNSPAADEGLRAQGREVIARRVVPAFRRLGEFVRDEYLPGCRGTIAARDLPNGEAFYEAQIRRHTTLPLTAREVHEIGVREVARIRAEMMGVIERSGFGAGSGLSGDALFAAFVEHLRTDERFYHRTPEALLTGYREICKRTDAELPRLFRKLPRLTYGVREMEAFRAPAAPTAYYNPGSLKAGVAGHFLANTYRLDQRPKYEMVPLALHEAVPGHHLQIAVSQELEEAGMHEWRTLLWYTAYGEGWALYAERLGLEFSGGERGFYEDPYDDFGRLSYEMWRALRLVVDPGMHALGWSRERAVEFMAANSALSRANIESEVDRYIAWPGQATGYKIGEIKIREWRAEAERALGEKFDVRAFHDCVLWTGSVPLPVLERVVREWVEATESGQP